MSTFHFDQTSFILRLKETQSDPKRLKSKYHAIFRDKEIQSDVVKDLKRILNLVLSAKDEIPCTEHHTTTTIIVPSVLIDAQCML